MRGSLILLAAVFAVSACSKADIDPLDAGQAELDAPEITQAVMGGASKGVFKGVSEITVERANSFVPSSSPSAVFKDSYESVSQAGGMVIKLDPAEFDFSGVTGSLRAETALVFYDPSCDECLDLSSLLELKNIDHVMAPVAFYSEDGLNVVGAIACEEQGLSDPSEACDAFSRGVRNNTKTLMLQGVVDVPSVLLPNGWLIENVKSEGDVAALLKEQTDG